MGKEKIQENRTSYEEMANHGDSQVSTGQTGIAHQQVLQYSALNAAANAIIITDTSGRILWCNRAFEDITGYQKQELLGQNPRILKSHIQLDGFYKEMWDAISTGRVWQGELINRRKDGAHYSERMTITPFELEGDGISHYIAIKEDITAAKKTQMELESRLVEMTSLGQVITVGIEEQDEDKLISRVTDLVGENIYSDHFGVLLLSPDKKSLRVHSSYKGIVSSKKEMEVPLEKGIVGRCAREMKTIMVGDVSTDRDYRKATRETRSELAVPLIADGKLIGVINAESKKRDNFLAYDAHLLETIANQLSMAISRLRANQQEREQRKNAEILAEIALLLNSSLDIEHILDQGLEILQRIIPYKTASVFLQNNGRAQVLRYRGYQELGLENWLESLDIDMEASTLGSMKTLYKERKTVLIPDTLADPRWVHMPNTSWIRSYMGVPIVRNGSLLGFINLNHDQPQVFGPAQIEIMTALANQVSTALERADLYRQQVKQLNFLESMRRIDHAITGNMDLAVTLNVIISEMMDRLKMDAVNIMSYDAASFHISLVAGKGFRLQYPQYLDITPSDGFIGEIIHQRSPLVISDLDNTSLSFNRRAQYADEDFQAYYGMPLIAKGKIVGVMELFHRSQVDLSLEWRRYVETVAAQTAIAIDNSQMFSDLQLANMELSMAYDSTLEGWAGALELRDHETEGHSRRVVELTMALAKELDIPKARWIHIRRGALLHDIGKMGVPDRILQKKGQLDDEEWEIMKKHPLYAREWLKQISYLKPALDIPLYHHERWDGTGYPEGLAGENIPIAARIFAVIDVWDALRSDRPYRPAWPVDKVKKYIREESGKHFDPAIVEIFLGIVDGIAGT